MKKIYHFLIIVTLLISSSGCEEFLEENPKSFSSASVYFTSKKGIEQMLMGAYQGGQGLYRGRTYAMDFGITSDEINWLQSNPSREELEHYVFTADNINLALIWQNGFYGINRANLLIEYLPKDFTDMNFINRIRAEGKFLRALYYFILVRTYGPVPLIAEYDNAPYYPVNSTVPKIYGQIIEDLLDAEQYLPNWKDIPAAEKGRASRGAAKALLAMVYLTRATSEAANSDDYTKAVAKTKEVIDGEGYDLWDNYFDAFHPDNENGKEDLFSWQFDAKLLLNSVHADFSPNPDIYGQAGYVSFCLTDDLYSKFEIGDERLTMIFKGAYHTEVAGDTKTYYTYNNKAFTQKYADPYNKTVSKHGTNFPIIRYSNVLLMYAEAENEINGPTNNAYVALNKVRQRSNVAALSGLTKETFRQAVRDERYKEFHGEGIRWFDLVRWGILVERVKAVKDVTVDWSKHKYFPFPQTEIDTNPNLTQNPGY